MARLFPSTLDGRSAPGGDERLFVHLERVLPDSHWAWYRPTLAGADGRRRPAFVLLGPGYGVLVLEAADWTPGTVLQGTRHWMLIGRGSGESVRVPHPERTASESAALLETRLKIPGLPVAWAVLYPRLSREDLDLLKARGVPLRTDRALVGEELHDEPTRLGTVLERLAAGPLRVRLEAGLRERVRAAVEPQLHFLDLRETAPEPPASASEAAPPPLPGFWLERKQERMARELSSIRTLVYGPAGSGKTVFLVARAQYWLDRNPEARVLFTCYNASLASHLRSVFRDRGVRPDGERLTVLHYHDLCGSILGAPDIHERSPEFYAALEPRVLQELSRREDAPTYDLILVDEGQDFTRRMTEVLVRLVAGGGEITLVSDPAQDIYGRWSEDTLSPLGDHEVEHLVDCYRNTAPIFALALAVLDPGVRSRMGLGRLELTRPEDLGRFGPPPRLASLESLDDLVELLLELARNFEAAGRPLSELAVLYPDRGAIPGFEDRLRDSTWEAAADPAYREAAPAETPAAPPGLGTLHPQSDRDDQPVVAAPHFARALVRELNARGIPAEWVARDFAAKAAFDITRTRLVLSTVHSAKGLDFHTVVLLGAETLKLGSGPEGNRVQALLFTGITRAREDLILPHFSDGGWVPELRARIRDLSPAG